MGNNEDILKEMRVKFKQECEGIRKDYEQNKGAVTDFLVDKILDVQIEIPALLKKKSLVYKIDK